ncbi:uL15 family ribosomal protein [Candidatus Woesearchaeota archaeon]|nr:uL15 family ribosomal protein [Candidatus Woesearchaeota archaeon]
MTVNKRKKNVRQRGSKTHGWGAKKKHRGKGHQGGAGMAGSGKRADSKKPSIWKDVHYFGKHGFVSKTPKTKIIPVNISYIEERLDKFLSQKLIQKENNIYSVELEKLGYNKLLGDGKVSVKFRINAPYASKSAIEKVKKAGGEVTGLAESAAKIEEKAG